MADGRVDMRWDVESTSDGSKQVLLRLTSEQAATTMQARLSPAEARALAASLERAASISEGH